jgi:hypothetical protein
LFFLVIECQEGKFHEMFAFAAEVVRGFDQIRLSLLGTSETALPDSISAYFVARMKANALNSVITAWVLNGHGRRTIRVDDAYFMR